MRRHVRSDTGGSCQRRTCQHARACHARTMGARRLPAMRRWMNHGRGENGWSGPFYWFFWAGRIAHNLDQPDRLHKTNQAGWALINAPMCMGRATGAFCGARLYCVMEGGGSTTGDGLSTW